jgi:hypothetical protein
MCHRPPYKISAQSDHKCSLFGAIDHNRMDFPETHFSFSPLLDNTTLSLSLSLSLSLTFSLCLGLHHLLSQSHNLSLSTMCVCVKRKERRKGEGRKKGRRKGEKRGCVFEKNVKIMLSSIIQPWLDTWHLVDLIFYFKASSFIICHITPPHINYIFLNFIFHLYHLFQLQFTIHIIIYYTMTYYYTLLF